MKKQSFGTRAAHSGKKEVPTLTRPVAMPIYQTSVYAFPDLDLVEAVQSGKEKAYLYARNGQPNAEALEEAYAELEGGEAAVSAATGMGAIFAVLFAMLEPGAHAVISRDIYGATYALFEQELARYNIDRTYVDASDLAAVAAAIRPETKILYAESISNPTVQVADLPGLAALCRNHKIKLVVDNTFASPFVMRPLELGADVVISSATKFLGGHSDLMAGVAAGATDLMDTVRRTLILNGAMLDPFAAWLTLRGIKTLHLRVERQCANALALARFLAGHPQVERVNYPGLQGHELLPNGAGAMLSFAVKGGLARANRVIRALELAEFVPSLGDVTTTVSHPVLTSHRAMAPEQREALGITENLIRVSVGVEAEGDILTDFAAALEA
ncbi:MAG TPA: aminotransferase class I/II-fold pyridoxal phosphate-dependent enzyme [Symbiobacteriaceae bacterium]|nr:aminotransferase class I/II-fold pyridoxal phosphate-dependent enzyme [Symbiobacteriaceae bacterium]